MKEKEAIKILKALSDETRLKIIKSLLNGEKCVCEIIPKVKRRQSTVSIQLGKLKAAKIVEAKRKGKQIFYRIKGIKNHHVCNIFRVLGYAKTITSRKYCCMKR